MSGIRHRFDFYLLLTLLLLIAQPAFAEIKKFALADNCKNAICLYWWPKLPKIDGWHQDIGSSYHYNANTLAPDGFTFSNADTVMLALATYKPKDPEDKTLEMFIDGDKENFKSSTISEADSLITADGKKLKSFQFIPQGGGNWERVTYAEEGDYYLTFTISARSEDGYKKNISAYEQLIKNYKE